jgi:integrase
MSIVKLDQAFIATKLICPDSQTKIEFVSDEISGFFIEVTQSTPGVGTYYLRIRDQHGKMFTQKLGRSTDISFTEAKNKARELRAQVTLGRDVFGERAKHKAMLTLDEFYEQYLKPFCQARQKSWKRTEQIYRIRIKPRFGHVRLDQITRHDIQIFHTRLLEEGCAQASCDHHVKFLRNAFNRAIEWSVFAGPNPAARIQLYAPDNRVNNIPKNGDELRKLLMVLRTDTNRTACQCALLAIATAMRSGELLKLTWRNIDLENQVIKIEAAHAKNKRQREVMLSDYAVSILHEIGTRGKYAHDRVFVNKRTGLPLTTISKSWERLRIKAGLPTMRFHDCRHLAGTIMSEQKIGLPVIAEALGHSSQVITLKRYTHARRDSMIQAVNNVADVIQAAMAA